MRLLMILAVTVLLLAGCQQAGLSPNERGEQTISNFVLSSYQNRGVEASPVSVTLPAKLAVAQVGEVAPPQWLQEYLRQQNRLFARVAPVPGVFQLEGFSNYSSRTEESEQQRQQEVQLRMRRIIGMARDLGMDYLFICGGDVQYGSESNPLAVLDWTIIGAYIVPGKNVNGRARAAGALIDARTERVVLLVSAETEKSSLSTWAGQNAAEQRILEKLREDALRKLADDLVGRLDSSPRVVTMP
jgi:hypothetical protein